MALSADMLQLIAALSGERWESEFITDSMAVHLTEELIKKWPKCQIRWSILIGGSDTYGRWRPKIHIVYMGNRIDVFVFFPSALRQTCKLLSKSSWTPIIQEFPPDNFFVVGDGLHFPDSSNRPLDRRLERLPAEDRVAVRGLIMAKQRQIPVAYIRGVKRGHEGEREATAKRLKLAGYACKDLHRAGYSKQALVDAGWSRRTVNNLFLNAPL